MVRVWILLTGLALMTAAFACASRSLQSPVNPELGLTQVPTATLTPIQ